MSLCGERRLRRLCFPRVAWDKAMPGHETINLPVGGGDGTCRMNHGNVFKCSIPSREPLYIQEWENLCILAEHSEKENDKKRYQTRQI